jgi:excisionase family DNA binding protein
MLENAAPITPILLRDREVAAMVGVSRRTVERWAKDGLLEQVRLGGCVRYRRSDLEALINGVDHDAP